jgi:hypothetical protein
MGSRSDFDSTTKIGSGFIAVAIPMIGMASSSMCKGSDVPFVSGRTDCVAIICYRILERSLVLIYLAAGDVT